MKLNDLATPALWADVGALEHNLAAMAAALPGERLRPHVKAHKCTALAQQQREHGHQNFTCATPGEVIGMAAAGLGDELLLANETVDADRLAAMAQCGGRVTIAVDSVETIHAAAAAGLSEVLIDVNVNLPRCGCDPADAGAMADAARAAGLSVRGVMGYEGHLMLVADVDEQRAQVTESMANLAKAHADVGGDIISGGGTGTYDLNELCTEIQAGSYVLIDTAYQSDRRPFRQGLYLLGTVIHVNSRWAVADVGLKAQGMDHGNPQLLEPSEAGEVHFCSDEHVTFRPNGRVAVGDKVSFEPAHIDPTMAMHDRLWLVDGDDVVDSWAIDLRGW